jgi:ATP-dependent exoDNAse (exonuclease V) beta subunit
LARELKAHRLAPECLPEAAILIHRTLTATLNDPAGGAAFRLCDVSECLPELEFMLPYGMGRQPALPDVRQAQGYLWGYIDLVFRHDGRFYLLDWKSNTLTDYHPDAVAASMRAEAYDLQGRLYALALHRWLTHRLPGYLPELHFGGVFYLYLRGLRDTSPDPEDSPGRGVYAWRPTARDLEQGYIEYLAEYLEVAPEVLAAAMPSTEKDK